MIMTNLNIITKQTKFTIHTVQIRGITRTYFVMNKLEFLQRMPVQNLWHDIMFWPKIIYA